MYILLRLLACVGAALMAMRSGKITKRWSYDSVPVTLQWDKEWVAREDGEVRYWSGDECKLFGGCTVYRRASMH